MSKFLLKTSPDFFISRLGLIITSVLGILFGLWAKVSYDEFMGFLVLLYWGAPATIACVVFYFIDINTVFMIDSEKSVLKSGVLSKKVNEVKHIDIRNIQIHQSLFERIFNIGSVMLSSAGQSDIEIKIRAIEEFKEVKELVYNQRNKLEGSKEKTVSLDDITTQIKKINDLKEKGIISEHEFEQKKKELLNRM